MLRKASLLTLVVLFAFAIVAPSFADKSKNDRVLSKVTFIHHKRAYGKPAGGGGGKTKDQGYYAYIARGALWRAVENVRLNPACGENPNGALNSLIHDAVASGMSAWENAGDASLAIFGNLTLDSTVTYDDGAFRGYNTISFGDYGDSSVIAVTTVWGYFGGTPATREITEAHILFNDAYEWGDAALDSDGDGSPDAYLMDVQNIATHELGHWAGMGDLYLTAAVEETMYGYSTEGELEKRDLYKGDIAGVVKLYQ